MVQLVVKSQILAGGRGLGTFKNGFQGGVHIVKADKVEETAGKILSEQELQHCSGFLFFICFWKQMHAYTS